MEQEDLTTKKCKVCVMCGRNENDGELDDPTPWLCPECRTLLHVVRNYMTKKLQDKDKQDTYIKGITQSQANETYSSWFCNFCQYNGTPCSQDSKKQKACIVKKIEKGIRKFCEERGIDLSKAIVSKVGIVCVRDKYVCVGCGKEIVPGDTAATWIVSVKDDTGSYVNTKSYMCLMCMRRYIRKAEREN